MKHLFLSAALVAAGAVALTSCSNEVLDEAASQPGAIAFNGMANKASRAGEVTYDNITSFRVWGKVCENGVKTGTNLFNDVKVTGSKASATWTYSPLKYWANSKDYYFQAVTTNDESTTWDYVFPSDMTNFDAAKGVGSVTFDCESAAANEDLLWAAATATTGADLHAAMGKVELAFNHLLSRIRVKLTNGTEAAAGASLKVTKIQFTGVDSKGTYDFANETWSAASGNGTTWAVDFGTTGDLASGASAETDARFIIPGTKTLNVALTVEITQAGNTTVHQHTATVSSKTFEKGNSYQLNATLTDVNQPIVFDVTGVTGWEAWPTGDDITIE